MNSKKIPNLKNRKKRKKGETGNVFNIVTLFLPQNFVSPANAVTYEKKTLKTWRPKFLLTRLLCEVITAGYRT